MRPVLPLTRRQIAVALLAVVAIGGVAALVVLPRADSTPRPEEPATTVAEAPVEDVPTDEVRYERVKPERAEAAREEVSAAYAEAQRLERQADIEPGPDGMMPASAGGNGSYEPPDRRPGAARVETSSLDGLPPERSALLIGRMAIAPPNAPVEVERAMSAANAIVGRPYVWGGGHGSWNDTGYDCSGAVSYALGGAGLLSAPLNSTGLMSWGEPGPGKWITVYANHEHTYAVIGGLRWDTVGQQNGTGPKWHSEGPYPQGYVVRHPPGL